MDGMDNLLMTYRDMTTRDWLVDAAVALAAFAVGCLQLMLTASSIIIPDLALRQYLGVVNVVPDLQVFVGLGMTVVPLVLRRRFPLPVFAACLVIFLGLQVRFSGFSMTVVGPLVALYTVAAECGTVPGIACGAAAVLSLLFAGAPMQAASMVFFTRFQNIALMVAAVLAGYAYRTHVAYVRAVEQRAAEAERTREEEAARRVEEERVRIAREVHDITAHSLSAVSIQLAAAERLVERDPRMAKEAVSTARATAKAALDDIRSMIGVLRHGDDAAETMPAAGTNQVDELESYLRGAGLDVTLDMAAYDRARVPAHVDMALFTVAREACTNAVRHARAQRVSLRFAVEDGAAHVVCDRRRRRLRRGGAAGRYGRPPAAAGGRWRGPRRGGHGRAHPRARRVVLGRRWRKRRVLRAREHPASRNGGIANGTDARRRRRGKRILAGGQPGRSGQPCKRSKPRQPGQPGNPGNPGNPG